MILLQVIELAFAVYITTATVFVDRRDFIAILSDLTERLIFGSTIDIR